MRERLAALVLLVLMSSCTCRGPGTVHVSTALAVSPAEFEFRPTLVGMRRTLSLTVRNNSRIAVTVEVASEGPFVPVDSRLQLAAGAEVTATIAFEPGAAGHFEALVRLGGAEEALTVPVSGEAVVCEAAGSCDFASWDEDAAECRHSALPDGRRCVSVCTSLGICAGGVCTGSDVDCDDQDPCTADLCEPASGCTHSPSTAACPKPTSACQVPTCDAETGCGFAPAADGAPCEEGCTVGKCQAGACVGAPKDCDDQNLCTADSCGADGECVHEDLTASCPNASPCTAPFCDPHSGCGVVPANEGRRCGAAISCAAVNVCVQGECVVQAAPSPNPNGCACNDLRPDYGLAVGLWHVCRRTPTAGVECWGDNGFGQLGNGSVANSFAPTPVPGLFDIVEVSAESLNTCARTRTGEVFCWGDNSRGQIAPTSAQTVNTPTQVVLPGKAVSITVGGEEYACAALEDGAVWCWGALGDLPGEAVGLPPSPPTLMPGFLNVVQVSANWYDLCALQANGSVQCVGWNPDGELGDGTILRQTAPVAAILPDGGTLQEVVEIAMGGALPGLCARTMFGEVRCAMIYGPTPSSATFPEPGRWLGRVELGGCATQLGRGVFHNCARLADGTARCWGKRNAHGELGTGNTAVPSNWMSDLSQISGVTEAQGGDYTSCATFDDGGYSCWGDNSRGQLGNGTTTAKLAP